MSRELLRFFGPFCEQPECMNASRVVFRAHTQGTKVQYRKSQLAPPRGTIQLESGTAVKAYPEFGPFCFCCQTNSVCLYAKGGGGIRFC